MKRLMKNEELFTLKCSTIQAFICSLPYLLPPVTALRVCVCVCIYVCVCYGASWPRKADRRCATHLSNFPKTVGLLPVHSLTLNQPQSATYLLKCLEPRLCVCVAVCVCVCGCLSVFLLFHYVIVFKSFFPPNSASYCVFMIKQ